MRKILILYYSKTGFTKKYAEWIAGALKGQALCELVPYADRNRAVFDGCDMILFGGGFHAGKINGVKWFRDRLKDWTGKKAAVFATGAMPADAPDVQKALRQNFSDGEWEKIKAFYLPGGLCYEKMSAGDRLMMAAFRKMLKLSNADRKMQEMVGKSYDISKEEYVVQVAEWCLER